MAADPGVLHSAQAPCCSSPFIVLAWRCCSSAKASARTEWELLAGGVQTSFSPRDGLVHCSGTHLPISGLPAAFGSGVTGSSILLMRDSQARSLLQGLEGRSGAYFLKRLNHRPLVGLRVQCQPGLEKLRDPQSCLCTPLPSPGGIWIQS